MSGIVESLGTLVGPDRKNRSAANRHSRTYLCRCGNHVFFRNTLCLGCQAQLGYLPGDGCVVPLEPGPRPGTWVAADGGAPLKACRNRYTPAWCNWMLRADDPNALCTACRLNRTIPDLDDADNARWWGRIEIAKRRLVSELLALGLPVKSKVDEDPACGLMFDFLRSPPQGPRVLTGHASGLITLNVEEADDARREKMRLDMRESYRTLLGHFRHEVGHYYWDRLVWDSRWLAPFRALFGDERADYAAALKANYANGPPADWPDRYISSYASTHPWEDWAETWAHYLHVVDTLGTALGFGFDAGDIDGIIEPFGRDALHAPDDAGAEQFLALLNAWVEMTMVLNELARGMGQQDLYPFVMSRPVVAKLQLVHLIVQDAHAAATAQGAPA
jgi:hypothetical protein